MISKNYSNILVEQLFYIFLILRNYLVFGFPNFLDLDLNDDELFVETLSGFPGSFIGDSSLLNYHKLLDVSE